MEQLELEQVLFKRISRLLEEYKIHAPTIILTQELKLVQESISNLLN